MDEYPSVQEANATKLVFKSNAYQELAVDILANATLFEGIKNTKIYERWLNDKNDVEKLIWEVSPENDVKDHQHLYVFKLISDGVFSCFFQGKDVASLFGYKNKEYPVSLRESYDTESFQLAMHLQTVVNVSKPVRCSGNLSFYNKTDVVIETIDIPIFTVSTAEIFIIGAVEII